MAQEYDYLRAGDAVSGQEGWATTVSYTHLDVYKRQIIKAGTIYPSNDNKAIGVVLQDYDVTESDASMALSLIHIQMCIRDS